MIKTLTGWAALGLGCLIAPIANAAMICTAQEQCRGDAVAMCAPSALEIEVVGAGTTARLWIDQQGPYSAYAAATDDGHRWTVEAFGGQHRLDLRTDGKFTYLGNRGKRFTGHCEGQA